jgi:hypothetical protein
MSKENASSPTVTTEAVLLACIIDAKEGCDVAVVDIPNVFVHMHVENDKDMAFIKPPSRTRLLEREEQVLRKRE